MPVLGTDSTPDPAHFTGKPPEKIFAHRAEGRSLAQGDWAAELDQSPDLSQRFSSTTGSGREGGLGSLESRRLQIPHFLLCTLS